MNLPGTGSSDEINFKINFSEYPISNATEKVAKILYKLKSPEIFVESAVPLIDNSIPSKSEFKISPVLLASLLFP